MFSPHLFAERKCENRLCKYSAGIQNIRAKVGGLEGRTDLKLAPEGGGGEERQGGVGMQATAPPPLSSSLELLIKNFFLLQA